MFGASYPPENIIWQTSESIQDDLFGGGEHLIAASKPKAKHSIPKSVLTLIKYALCHQDASRFALCYRVLWRVIFENKNLIQLKTDEDIMQLITLAKAVKRDAYKISAFFEVSRS